VVALQAGHGELARRGLPISYVRSVSRSSSTRFSPSESRSGSTLLLAIPLRLARSPELANDDLSTIGKIVKIVGPLLHHALTLGKMRCPVVGAPVRIAHRMG
jgi:hypothetical protein